MHRLVCGPPKLPLLQLASVDAGANPCFLDNKTPAVATYRRRMCAPPCVCTALCVDRKTSRCFDSLRSTRQRPHPVNNNTLAVATHCVVCAPPCVCTPLCMHRFVCRPPNLRLLRLASLNAGASSYSPLELKDSSGATHHLVCASPRVCTPLRMHHLVCAPPGVCTALCVYRQTDPCCSSLPSTPSYITLASLGGAPQPQYPPLTPPPPGDLAPV